MKQTRKGNVDEVRGRGVVFGREGDGTVLSMAVVGGGAPL